MLSNFRFLFSVWSVSIAHINTSLTVNLHMKRGKWTAQLKKTDWAHTRNCRADNINVIGKLNGMNALLPMSIVLSSKMLFAILTKWVRWITQMGSLVWLLYTLCHVYWSLINQLYIMRKLYDTKKLLPFEMLEEIKKIRFAFRSNSHKQYVITTTNWQN